jgi:hypothetical protein
MTLAARWRRARAFDRGALVVLVALALAGAPLVDAAVLELDPALAVALAWERGGGGATSRFDAGGPRVMDPWGRPFRWDAFDATVHRGTSPALEIRTSFQATSDGPDPTTHDDDLWAGDPARWPAWERSAARWPGATTLVAVVYGLCAWIVARARRRRTTLDDVALGLAAALPLAPLAWAVARTDAARIASSKLPLAVPGPVAVCASLWGLAAIVLVALRLAGRRSRPVPRREARVIEGSSRGGA